MIARRRMVGRRVARVAVGTAVVAGTAGAVQHHQAKKYAQQDQAEYDDQVQQQQAYDQQQYAPPPPAPAPAPAEDPIDQIERLGKLKEEGLLTEEEFAAQKAKILGT
ncbi:MAG: SHOCT domain-containing protein [Caldilineaceae bacterium]|jgi:hypothetical protein